MKFLVINGPNINMLGIREKNIYGSVSFAELLRLIGDYCDEHNVDVSFFQSNHEGALVDVIQDAYGKFDGIIINPAAYTHTSIAILDALKSVNIPAVEVHISDITLREEFRRFSYVSSACIKTIYGLGPDGYLRAVDAIIEHLKK